MRSVWIVAPILFLASLAIMSQGALADGGMIPVTPFEIYEPGQKAIIAWNGETEMMMLSVDVYGTEGSQGLHFVPFPSMPEVELGSTEAFHKINQYLVEEMESLGDDGWNLGVQSYSDGGGNRSVEIVFHDTIGPHDVTVVEVSDYHDFSTWVEDFLSEKGYDGPAMPGNLEDVVENYLDQDIRYFAFDLVEISPYMHSVEPLVYTFQTPAAFFPMEVSSVIPGSVEITLAFLTPDKWLMERSPVEDFDFDLLAERKLTFEQVEGISSNISALFNGEDVRLEAYEKRFYLSDLEGDVWIQSLGARPPEPEPWDYRPAFMLSQITIVAVALGVVWWDARKGNP